ncbi:RING-type zinc-finger [Trypanosoma melophagium]|uniref:RING-type zinc-finger n=1 Tax=Trypanosoma melophagium TaxID=715481 RepID=UPI00351AA7E3|nr:RING-type zinc-finger [Trypanosoma melophagium]
MTQCRQFSKCEEVEPVIVCRLCEDPWDTPVELQPCGHIFCKICLLDYKSRCPSTSSSTGGSTNVNKKGGKTTNVDTDEMRGTLCPTCRSVVSGVESPNRLLVNMALAVSVRCARCGWQGSREQSEHHVCEAEKVGENSSVGMEGPSSELLRNFGEVESLPSSRMGQDLPAPPLQPSGSGSGNGKWEEYGLTQEEYDQIMGVFVHFDTEGRGFLTRAQLRELAFSLNYVNREGDIDRMLSEMGCDEAGGLMLADLCKWLGTHYPNPEALYGLSQYQYTQVVLQYRSHMDDRGLLSWDAFRELCLKNNYAENNYEAWELFRSCGNSSDGAINLHKFLLLCRRLWGIGVSSENIDSNVQLSKQQQERPNFQPELPSPPPHLPYSPSPPHPIQAQPHQQYANPYGSGGPPTYETPSHPPVTPSSAQMGDHGKRKKECSVM